MASPQHEDDKMLLDRLQKGDQQAFTALYDKYWEHLYSKACFKTGSAETAEDLVHEVFTDLWKNREKLIITHSFAGWITTALKYKIFRWLDARSVRKRHVEQEKPLMTVSSTETEEQLAFGELYHLIEEKIDALPEKCRTVFRLSREDQKTVKEIAKELNISPNTAQNHINTALKTLRGGLKEYL